MCQKGRTSQHYNVVQRQRSKLTIAVVCAIVRCLQRLQKSHFLHRWDEQLKVCLSTALFVNRLLLTQKLVANGIGDKNIWQRFDYFICEIILYSLDTWCSMLKFFCKFHAINTVSLQCFIYNKLSSRVKHYLRTTQNRSTSVILLVNTDVPCRHIWHE